MRTGIVYGFEHDGERYATDAGGDYVGQLVEFDGSAARAKWLRLGASRTAMKYAILEDRRLIERYRAAVQRQARRAAAA